jgi:hypothetical protein
MIQKSTFGAPFLARLGSGHAGDESFTIRPIVPGNAAPRLYSFSAMISLSVVGWPPLRTQPVRLLDQFDLAWVIGMPLLAAGSTFARHD